ncbi:acyl-CoA thioesterase domain-containing protein [Mycolicibacterium goodii]|uniref:acyl-CoA thioesterase domain-containing protein n=1 Tax=Mycolicibacterium goodii TaxID=134601 RepID=UPI0006739F83
MTADLVFFAADNTSGAEKLVPLAAAAGNWGPSRMRGMAVSGALARAAERSIGRPDMRPVRWTLDLYRPAALAPCNTCSRVVRSGRRLCLVESELLQNDSPVARSTALFLQPDYRTPEGRTWAPSHDIAPPPTELAPTGRESRLYYSEGIGWTGSGAEHQSAARKQVWILPVTVVEGEQSSPFVHAASSADVASLVSNWGNSGMEFINADVTLTLSRPPVSTEIGFSAMDRTEADGISVGTSAVFDRAGVLGTALVCAMINGGTKVDPRVR